MASQKKAFSIATRHGVYRAWIVRDAKSRTYRASAADLPGVLTFGTSLADAKRMVKDAIELHCDCLIEEKKLVVDDHGKVAGRIPRSRVLVPA